MNSVKMNTKLIYTNSLHFHIRIRWEKEKGNNPFTLEPKRKTTKKGRNVTNKVKELDTENHKTQIKETEDSTNQWREDTHGVEQSIVSKCPPYPKQWTDLM